MTKRFFPSSLAIPAIVSAQGILPQQPAGLPGNPSEGPSDLAQAIIQVILGFAGIVAVLFIIIGGFQYMTSAGNDELAARGKKTLVNAVIGLVLIIISYIIVVVISNALIGYTT